MSRTLFGIGFSAGSLLFPAANLYSYSAADPCCDQIAPFGFPLTMGTFGGLGGRTHFILPGLMANMVICLAASGIAGWAFARASRRIIAAAGRAAAWHSGTRLR